ncbi:hypothetical protein WJX84_005751 [Apatococcus fuscideae]|uniref:UvrD-like helicase C-terminal domain-containing protein n=1 Tax=Apatococcus fuscideae TaxID=2026836 RepID=A0AAW1S9Z9_9CHLO
MSEATFFRISGELSSLKAQHVILQTAVHAVRSSQISYKILTPLMAYLKQPGLMSDAKESVAMQSRIDLICESLMEHRSHGCNESNGGLTALGLVLGCEEWWTPGQEPKALIILQKVLRHVNPSANTTSSYIRDCGGARSCTKWSPFDLALLTESSSAATLVVDALVHHRAIWKLEPNNPAEDSSALCSCSSVLSHALVMKAAGTVHQFFPDVAETAIEQYKAPQLEEVLDAKMEKPMAEAVSEWILGHKTKLLDPILKAVEYGRIDHLPILAAFMQTFHAPDSRGQVPMDLAKKTRSKGMRKHLVSALEQYAPISAEQPAATSSDPQATKLSTLVEAGTSSMSGKGTGQSNTPSSDRSTKFMEFSLVTLLAQLTSVMASPQEASGSADALEAREDPLDVFQRLLSAHLPPTHCDSPAPTDADAMATVDDTVPSSQPADDDIGKSGDFDALDGLPWSFTITRKARQEWAGLDLPFRRMVLNKLRSLAMGLWPSERSVKRINASNPALHDLELWSCKLLKGARILFEIAVDFEEASRTWKEMLRLWVITLSHDDYERAILSIQASHLKSRKAQQRLKLRAIKQDLELPGQSARVPKTFNEEATGMSARLPAAPHAASTDVDLREHHPAANPAQDTYTMLKFYNLQSALVKSVMDGLNDEAIDFPFRVSPSEQRIIELDPSSSIILVGRSGTGKTTCAVYRIWAQWLASRSSDEPVKQVFITASATLRLQVAKAFRKLQAAVVGLEQAAELEQAALREIHTFANVSARAFPLFLSTRAYLYALDATLPSPFLKRNADGSLVSSPIDYGDAEGTLEVVEMDLLDTDDDEADGDGSSADGRGDDTSGSDDDTSPTKGTAGVRKQELSFMGFKKIWTAITTKEERLTLQPTLVYQEVVSYIKGSREALETAEGFLSLEQYLMVGKKRAPNFSEQERRRVYPVFQAYMRHLQGSRHGGKHSVCFFDNLDLVAHLYRAFSNGYSGTQISNIYRDEVQDFTQAELLLDFRVVSSASGLFYCGDSCQTIARGVGFRTHSGITNVAASVVDLIRHHFPLHLDRLAREEAFFSGPLPLLLTALKLDDLAILLGGSDRASSQVEFGAHQVVLVRETSKREHLPPALQQSRALVMTVPQAKGLEFDDVFLLDFFADSPANTEWRVLLTYLEEMVPQGATEVDMEAEADLRPLRFDPLRHGMLCEELKHLYTAITRAKNNVIIFDSNPKKRAPFFQYLQRLNLARVVRSILTDGLDASQVSLRQVKDSPAEWCRRGVNLLDNKLYEFAQQCFETANDAVYAAVTWAITSLQKLGRMQHGQKKACRAQVGKALLFAAANADQALLPVSPQQRRAWAQKAAIFLAKSGHLDAHLR